MCPNFYYPCPACPPAPPRGAHPPNPTTPFAQTALKDIMNIGLSSATEAEIYAHLYRIHQGHTVLVHCSQKRFRMVLLYNHYAHLHHHFTQPLVKTDYDGKYDWHERVTKNARIMAGYEEELAWTYEEAVDALMDLAGLLKGKSSPADKVEGLEIAREAIARVKETGEEYREAYSKFMGMIKRAWREMMGVGKGVRKGPVLVKHEVKEDDCEVNGEGKEDREDREETIKSEQEKLKSEKDWQKSLDLR